MFFSNWRLMTTAIYKGQILGERWGRRWCTAYRKKEKIRKSWMEYNEWFIVGNKRNKCNHFFPQNVGWIFRATFSLAFRYCLSTWDTHTHTNSTPSGPLLSHLLPPTWDEACYQEFPNAHRGPLYRALPRKAVCFLSPEPPCDRECLAENWRTERREKKQPFSL